MNERPGGAEQERQPEEIRLGQEFFPYRNVQPTQDLYSSSKDYKLLVPNTELFVHFSSFAIIGDGLEIKPFGTGYTVDERDRNLTTRKNKLTATPRLEKIDPDAPLHLSFLIFAQALEQAGMATISETEVVLTDEAQRLLSLLRLGVSAKGSYEGRILEFNLHDEVDTLAFSQFYPVDIGPLAGDSSWTGRGDESSEDSHEIFASPGHYLLLPNDKTLLDQVRAKFYLAPESKEQLDEEA